MTWEVSHPLISFDNADLRNVKVELDLRSIRRIMQGSNFIGARVSGSRWSILGGTQTDVFNLKGILKSARDAEDAYVVCK